MGRGDQAGTGAVRDGRRDAGRGKAGHEARRGQAADEDALHQLGRHGGPAVRVDELRVLEQDELGVRLRTARRELYELRFKHAVGQLDNSSQIKKVRHDIARIMTVLRERDFGILASPQVDEPEAVPAAAAVAEPEAQPVAEEEAPKPKRGRRAKKEEDAG